MSTWRRRGSDAALLLDLRHLGGVLAEDADRLRVVEDVGDVLRRAVGVDRRSDRADLREREVEQRPLERRPGERRERVALADAAGQQAVREVLDPLGRLGPGDLVPVVAVLDEVGRARPIPGDGVAPETGDRAIGAHGCAI